MQESVVDEQDAERAGASWYLTRNGEQIGPLSERELSMFAEGGNFKPGDLLWTAGLDGWKPADAIFGLAGDAEETEIAATPTDATAEAGDTGELKDAEFVVDEELDEANAGGPTAGDTPVGDPSETSDDTLAETGTDAVFLSQEPEAAISDPALRATHHGAPHLDATHLDAAHLDANHLDGNHLEGSHPPGEHVHAIVQALKGQAESAPLTLKERFFAELRKFAGAGVYLWAVFSLMAAYAWVGAAQYGPGLGFFVLTTINAFFAFQLMGLAERFRFIQDLRQKPLIYSIAYKTLTFGTLVFALYTIELIALDLLGGDGSSAGGGLVGTLALWFILSVAMLPYFAFKALERAVGADMIAKLLFGKG